MDLKSMLNSDDELDAHKSSRQLLISPNKPPPLLSLTTSLSASPGLEISTQRPVERPYPYSQYSNQSPAPQSRSQTTNYLENAYSGSPTPLTPHYFQSPIPGISYGPVAGGSVYNLNRHPSHPSQSRKSSSTQSYTPYAQFESPVTARPPSHQVSSINVAQQQSPPSTPLGAPFLQSRASNINRMDSPAIYQHQRTSSAISYTSCQGGFPSPQPSIQPTFPQLALPLGRYNHLDTNLTEHDTTRYSQTRRESSLSVSPKTIINSTLPLSSPDDQGATDPQCPTEVDSMPDTGLIFDRKFHVSNDEANQKPIKPKRKTISKTKLKTSTKSTPRHQIKVNVASEQGAPTSELRLTMPGDLVQTSPIPESLPLSLVLPSSLETTAADSAPSKMKRNLDSNTATDKLDDQPPAKRRRHEQIPVWALRAKNTTPLPKHAMHSTSVVINHGSLLNGHAMNDIVQPIAQPKPGADNPLEPWEPSINNLIPYEELTREISNFLYGNALSVPGFDEPGGIACENNGQLEIEAKLGRIIDKKTNKRLYLPIKTESVIDDTPTGLDVAFESSMTEKQHENFNKFLNGAVESSALSLPAKPRIPIQFVHTRETDTFYDLPPSELTGFMSILAGLNASPGRQPKVRVTKDQKTGKILAKIVKARIKDLHVYSPGGDLDWRVSVSFEMNWDGDVERLIASQAEEGHHNRHPERNKDRMSYRHLAYQIDLTQVKPGNAGPDSATHELEVEVSSAEVKRLALEKPNQYEELIRGFVDNVRILARQK